MAREREFVLAVLGKQEDPFQLAVPRSSCIVTALNCRGVLLVACCRSR